MAYTPEFSTERAIYRVFYTDHNTVTQEDILNSERISGLDGIVLEVTGDHRLPNPPENALRMYDHSGVIRTVKSLGKDGPPIYVVDVHMNDILKDTLPDYLASLLGGGLAAFGVRDFVKLRRVSTRRELLRRSIGGSLKIAAAFPLGTMDRIAMEILSYSKGEIGDGTPLKWHYFDLVVPDMVIGRDLIYARKLEEGIVPLAHNSSSRKVKFDLHLGAGHTRMPRFIQNKKLRDELLNQYSEQGFSDFDKTNLNKVFVFRYNPSNQNWDKQEHDVKLF